MSEANPTPINREWFLNELIQIRDANPADIRNDDGSLRSPLDWPEPWGRMVTELTVSERMTKDGRVMKTELIDIKFIDQKVAEDLLRQFFPEISERVH